MALRAVPDHPKFARLKRTLQLSKCPCLGYLEGLWHFAGKFTPHGDLGKYSNEDIESWLEWEGEAGALISALTLCGWVDRSETHRLVVHDWDQHADDATRAAVKRSKREFVSKPSPPSPTPPRRSDTIADSPTASLQCPDTIADSPTVSRQNPEVIGTVAELTIVTGLPVPVPVPEPVPEPVPVPEPGPGIKPPASEHDPPRSLPEVRNPFYETPPVTLADLVYAAYPRKVGPGAAKVAIGKAAERLQAGTEMPRMNSPGEALKFLQERAAEFALSPAGNAGEFTPHAATWFNQGRYLDDPKEWQRGNDPRSGTRGEQRTNGNLQALERAEQLESHAKSVGGAGGGETGVGNGRDPARLLASA